MNRREADGIERVFRCCGTKQTRVSSNFLHVILTVAGFVTSANVPVVFLIGMNSEEGNSPEPTFQFDPGGNGRQEHFCWFFLVRA